MNVLLYEGNNPPRVVSRRYVEGLMLQGYSIYERKPGPHNYPDWMLKKKKPAAQN